MSADRHAPLDGEERELARVLRALPAGEPPSSLDTRLLALARDAVVAVPEGGHRAARPRRAVWALGLAVICALVAALAWRFSDIAHDPGEPLPQDLIDFRERP